MSVMSLRHFPASEHGLKPISLGYGTLVQCMSHPQLKRWQLFVVLQLDSAAVDSVFGSCISAACAPRQHCTLYVAHGPLCICLQELARRLPEPEEMETKGKDDFLRQGPWQWVNQHPLPAMNDYLKKCALC